MKVIIMARAVLNPPAEVQESIGKYTEQQRQEFVERGTAHFRKVIGKELDGIADLDVKVILREEDDQAAQIITQQIDCWHCDNDPEYRESCLNCEGRGTVDARGND